MDGPSAERGIVSKGKVYPISIVKSSCDWLQHVYRVSELLQCDLLLVARGRVDSRAGDEQVSLLET